MSYTAFCGMFSNITIIVIRLAYIYNTVAIALLKLVIHLKSVRKLGDKYVQ